MGSYVDNNLISGEKVLYEARLHGIIFFPIRAFVSLFILPLIDRATSEFVGCTPRPYLLCPPP